MTEFPIPKKVKVKRIKPTAKTLNRERAAEKRSERGQRRSDLRSSVVDRNAGECEWSSCQSVSVHMAHIAGIGRGGDPTGIRDQSGNVAMLCIYHHDILDAREPMRMWEVEQLLHEVIKLRGQQ